MIDIKFANFCNILSILLHCSCWVKSIFFIKLNIFFIFLDGWHWASFAYVFLSIEWIFDIVGFINQMYVFHHIFVVHQSNLIFLQYSFTLFNIWSQIITICTKMVSPFKANVVYIISRVHIFGRDFVLYDTFLD
jgi:hypothetical protein